MGSQVALYFLKWVEAEGHGGGGSNWVETHIEAFINVGFPHVDVGFSNCS